MALLCFLFCNFMFLIQNCLWVVCDVLLVPPKSYAEVLNPVAGKKILSSQPHLSPSNKTKLCPFQEAGECKYGSQCVYIHGDTCDLCGHACLHPQDKEQRKKHINVSSDITSLPYFGAVLCHIVCCDTCSSDIQVYCFSKYTGCFMTQCFRVLHSEVIPSQKCHTDMCLMVSGNVITDIWISRIVDWLGFCLCMSVLAHMCISKVHFK